MSTHEDHPEERDRRTRERQARVAPLAWGPGFAKGGDAEPTHSAPRAASDRERRWAQRLGWLSLGIVIGLAIAGHSV